jgi:nucleoside phosphorylase
MALLSAPAGRHNFEIAIICALPLEASAVEALFDKFWEDDGIKYGKAKGDPNAYTTGVIGEQNVVLAHMPHMGKISAAGVAASLSLSFTGIKLALIVGICGGVPSGHDGKKEILLGDVIISEALVQYDFGRQNTDVFERKDTLEDNLGRADIAIRSMLRKLQTDRGCQRIKDQTIQYLAGLTQKVKDARYPGPKADILFEPSYRHIHRNDDAVCLICTGNTLRAHEVCEDALHMSCYELGCDPSRRMKRRRLSILGNVPDTEDAEDTQNGEVHRPQIHIGRMGSGDTVMKSGEHRDWIARRDKVIAFEMEGAGVWDYFPSLVIKGVCDYADSHKNKEWQFYAATTAAACTKAFLNNWASENHSPPQASEY